MILSKSYGFIFYHVPKTGGTSITHALGPLGTVIWGASSKALPRFDFCHMSYLQSAYMVQMNNLEKPFRFAFVRHPVTRLISTYHHLALRKWVDRDFDLWVRDLVPGQPSSHTEEQWKFLTSGGQDELKMDFIGRYERLESEFAQVCELIGWRAKLQKINSTNVPEDQKIIPTDDAIEHIARIYAADFRLFGYEPHRW